MRHAHQTHGVRSIDHLAYTSGMGGWNPAFKTALALGTLVICLAADRPAVSAAVILALAALQKAKGGLALHDYLGLLRVPLVFLLLGGLAVACDLSRVPAGDWSPVSYTHLDVYKRQTRTPSSPSPRSARAIWTKITRSSSACRPTSP